jgi:hypothetical protein
MTPEQRIIACQQELNELLRKYGCVLAGSWEQIDENKAIRSRQIVIEALADWKEPEKEAENDA